MRRKILESIQGLNIPRYEQVRWEIQCLLTESQWDADKPLPTESELAKRYEVSVGTVRKAVEKLVEDGILQKQQGRGTFLKQPNFETSLSRFFKFRDKNSDYVTPTGVVKKVVLINGVSKINKKLNLKDHERLVYLERIRVIDHRIILSERIWLPESLFHPLAGLRVEDFGNLLYPFYYEICNQFVSSAVEKLTFKKNHIDAYLSNGIDESLVKICRVAKNLKGESIEYRESFGLADSFSYEITIN